MQMNIEKFVKWYLIFFGLVMVWIALVLDSFDSQITVFVIGVILILFSLGLGRLIKYLYKKYLETVFILIKKKVVYPIGTFIGIIIFMALIGYVLFFIWNKVSTAIWNSNHQISGWVFAGYSYRWSSDYVENKGLTSELECVDYGDKWIKKQDSEEAIYTCSSGCRDAKDLPGMLICKKICEYEKTGLIRCRD